MKPIQIGTVFYDERNDRYLTTVSTGCDPKCWMCEQRERNDNDEYEITDHVLLMENELRHMKGAI